jgi:hypothetical protein
MRLRIEAKDNDIFAVVSSSRWRNNRYALMARVVLRHVRECAEPRGERLFLTGANPPCDENGDRFDHSNQ